MNGTAILDNDELQAGDQVRRRPGSHGFYRMADGWITTGDVSPSQRSKYEAEGWVWLRSYGTVELMTEYAADHPFEGLFMLGGAKELPVEQVVAMGFHLKAPDIAGCGIPLNPTHMRHKSDCLPRRKVTFPQIAGLDLEGFPCHFCQRDPFPSEMARAQHEEVMHQDAKGDLRTGDALANALVRGLRGAGVTTSIDRPESVDGKTLELLKALGRVGMNKKQIEALKAAGYDVGEEESDGE